MTSNMSTLSGSVIGNDSNVTDDDIDIDKANEKFEPVTLCKHGGSPSKDRPPEAKAAVVVDCVVGLRLVVDDFVQCDDDI